MFADKQLYLRVSTGDDGWNDVTKFAIYYFNDTQNGWTDFMTPVEENVYTATIPAGMTTVIFTRQNKDADEPNWDNRWSQTKNKTIPTDENLFTITSGGRTWDCDGEWSVYEPAPADPNKFYITGDSALVVDAGLDKAKAWDSKAIGSEKDTCVLSLKAGTDYLLKVVDEGAWKGFEALTDTAAGLKAEAALGGDHNIGFKLSAAGDVQVIYKKGEIFKLIGAFEVPEPEPEPEYFLVRASNEWAVVEADKFAVTETEGEFKLAATLVLGDEIKVLGIAGEDTTWYPDGLGNAFEITEKFTGEHDIYFRPAGNDDWKSFHEGGFFWMGANPDPEPELVELNLVPGPWVDGSNAKIAAWIWGEKLAGEWTEFIGLEGDTLKFNVKETADSLIFVRFADTTKVPAWYDNGQIWNRMPSEEIDYVGKTYTITAYDKGQWEPYIITPFNLYLALGKWAEPDEKARYAIYTIDNAKWIDLAAVEDKEDVLFAEVPGTITQVVFCRMNPEALENDWKNIWNQTADLLIPEGKDQFTITGWGEGEGAKSEGVWSKYGEEPQPVVAEYFFIGSRIEWSVPALTEDLKFTLNEGAEVEEYKLDITLVAGEYFKVVKLEGETQTWFIEGDDKARLVAEEEAGDVTIYFRPEVNPSWAETDLGGHIYIHKAATGVEETAVEGKAVKALRDGQLVIIKNGVRYNVIGIRF